MEEIKRKLTGRKRRVLDPSGYVPAAVLIPLFFKKVETMFLLTERSRQVEYHKGQISFPGGVYESEDGDLLKTALRETEEEVGIKPQDVNLLGAIDDDYTVTGFCVTPFVGLIPYPYAFQPNAGEIEKLHEVPVRTFLDGRNLREELREYEGKLYPTLFYSCGTCEVWGATARIVRRFVEIVQIERDSSNGDSR